MEKYPAQTQPRSAGLKTDILKRDSTRRRFSSSVPASESENVKTSANSGDPFEKNLNELPQNLLRHSTARFAQSILLSSAAANDSMRNPNATCPPQKSTYPNGIVAPKRKPEKKSPFVLMRTPTVILRPDGSRKIFITPQTAREKDAKSSTGAHAKHQHHAIKNSASRSGIPPKYFFWAKTANAATAHAAAE